MRFVLPTCLLLLLDLPVLAQDEGLDFFEKKIRPVLVERCYSCHSQAGKQRGGLHLDTRASLRQGGDSGPAIVPGKPEASLLLKAVRRTGELRMPPQNPLSPNVVADLERWIALGAPDPRTAHSVAGSAIDFAAAAKHWAYQPIRKPALPAVQQKDWPRSPIDAFVLARLEAQGLKPSPAADQRALLRRVYFDLIGLPPTLEETEAFVKDPAPNAYARVVDHLLASPHYGERWGRHWLDVARYADTKDGVLMYGPDRVRPYAYTYREYVVRALNDDVPFDRFVQDQLAADLLYPSAKVGGPDSEAWRLGALGFLTLGRMFDNNIHDIIDDRIDTVTRGFLGLTVSCARCHDHKYDAVPTADYYALYGVFANCESPLELPLLDAPDGYKAFAAYEKEAGPHRQKMEQLLEQQHKLLSETARQRVGDYLLRVATTPPDLAETAIYFLSLAPTDLRPQLVNRWRRYLDHPARANDPIFGPWPELMALPEAGFADKARAVLGRWQERLHPLVRAALQSARLQSKADVAKAYGELLRKTYEQSKKTPLLSLEQQPLLELVTGKHSPCYFPKSETPTFMSRSEKDAYNGMKTRFDRMAVQHGDVPPRAMVVRDANEIVEPRLFVRGNPSAPGDTIPRQMLRIVAGPNRQPFKQGSGRLELARALTAPDNPLTSRVLVNRVWLHHFGEPLVSSPSDFGTRSTPPTHPELLDWLAAEFISPGLARGVESTPGKPGANGGMAWSMKQLHRHIVLSQTYRQASVDRPEARKVDPENRLLWRMHRRRLDFEAFRDALLTVSGRLDRKLGGRPVDIVNDAKNSRRTLYGLVDRQSLPGLFRAFDFASPDASAERRPLTTTPQQALFGLNSPFMAEQAKALAARTEKATGAGRVTALYRLALARSPQQGEVERSLRFIAETERSGERSQFGPWQQLAQALLLTNEFAFVD